MNNTNLPRVVSRNSAENGFQWQLDVPADLHWFRGHFPGHPVLPGVVQLHWAVTAARIQFDLDTPIEQVVRLKFRSVIVPPRTLELRLEQATPRSINFEIASGQQIHSQGRLNFAGDSLC